MHCRKRADRRPVPCAGAPFWEALDHVEVSGTYAGIIHLKHPFAPLFISTLPHALGLIVCKKALEATKDKKIGTAPAACSEPYKIGDW